MKTRKYKFNYSDNLVKEIPNLEPLLNKALDTRGKKPLQEYVRKITGKPDLKIAYKGIIRHDKNKLPTYDVALPTMQKENKKEGKVLPCQDLSKKEQPQKEYFVGVVRGVKYELRGKEAIRNVVTNYVWSKRDPKGDPDLVGDLLFKAEEDLFKRGYFLHEDDALSATTRMVGEMLSKLAHELEYSDDGPCRGCTRYAIQGAEDLLTLARDAYDRRYALMEDLKCDYVGVFPNSDEMDKYEVKDRKFVLKNPPTERIKIGEAALIDSRELPPDLREGISKWLKSQKAGK